MALSSLNVSRVGFLFSLLTLVLVYGQSQDATSTTASVLTATIAGEVVTYSPQFTVPAAADEGASLLPNSLDPNATDAQTVCPGYNATDVVRGESGFSATLTLAGAPCNVYGNDVETLNLTVAYQNADRLSIYIRPLESTLDSTNTSWYILNETLVPRPGIDSNAEASTQNNDLQFSWSNDPSFSFSVTRKSTGDVLFDTSDSVLVFEDQFVEFVTAMPENYNLYGLGERIHGLRLGNNFTATIYAADAGDPIDDNIYGSHPIYMDTRYYEVGDDGSTTLVTSNETDTDSTYQSYSHGVFLRNAHGQEVLMRSDNITWRTIGGSIDLYFYDGPTAPDVIKQHQEVIGFPALQQYFTFGYHQCRWGYQNWSVVQGVVDSFARFGIPLENIWTDIDYMKHYRDFDMDPNTFPVNEGQNFLSQLHENHQHYIPIVDSAIYIPNPDNETDAYPTYNRGNDSGVFLNNPDGSQYIGSVWPGYTVFPDWQAGEAVNWWSDEMSRWHNDIPFDGIWIDMSEVSSFCVGSCGTGNLSLNPVHPSFKLPGEAGNLQLDYPEGFNITNATEASSVSSASSTQFAGTATSDSSSGGTATSTASVGTDTASASDVTTSSASSESATSSTSYLRTTPTPGSRNVNYPPYVINNVQGDLAIHAVSPNATHQNGVEEYDVHNLWGHQILNATYQALLSIFPDKRPFIIGRSTFAGSGKWAGHWGGDNYSRWAYMYFAIPQALNFALFGFPMFGPDTCGFNGNSDEELCNRWMQLSAFFPFYRNHNTLSTISQEPYVWASVIDASKTAMAIRYSLLPYMYTLFHAAHTTGSTVMRALAWEFPNEPNLANVDRQFLLGPSLLVTPVLEQGAVTVDGIFPGIKEGTVWYDWYTRSAMADLSPGQNVTIDAPLGHIPIYVRGGSVLPMQEPALTTYDARRSPWSLLVALDVQASATGSLYIDDGESLVQNATLNVNFSASNGSLSASATGTYNASQPLANVTVLGVEPGPQSLTLNDQELSSGWTYNATSQTLAVTGLDNITSLGAWAQDWTLSWT